MPYAQHPLRIICIPYAYLTHALCTTPSANHMRTLRMPYACLMHNTLCISYAYPTHTLRTLVLT